MLDEDTKNWKVSKRRWIILVLLTLLQVLSGISFSSFGQISNFYVTYFNVSYTQVEWMTLGFDTSPIFFTLPLVWLAYRRMVRFRILAIFCSLAMASAYACFAISMVFGGLFWLSVIGQTINGLAAQILMSTPALFAACWFGDDEVGTAISVNLMGLFAGYGIGAVVPTQLLSFTYTDGDAATLTNDKDTLLLLFSACFVTAILITLIMCLVVDDLPPHPPNLAQAQKRMSTVDVNTFWPNTFKLLRKKTFLLSCVVFGIIIQSQTVEFTLMAEIIKSIPAEANADTDPIGGYVMFCYSVGSILGTLPAAMLVNRLKQYGKISIVGTWLVFCSSSCIALGVVFGSIPAAYAGNVRVGSLDDYFVYSYHC